LDKEFSVIHFKCRYKDIIRGEWYYESNLF